jgi:hypothetical protein
MGNRDERLSRSGVNRVERESADRPVTQDREITDGQRLDMLRSQFFQVALPDLPPIPGYHVCWLTTTNSRDPIHGRLRLGYEPIKAADIPGWEHSAVKGGDWEGCVGVNEMLAMKLPQHLYEMYMKEAHHDAPLREEQKLSATLDMIRNEAARRGARVDAGDGNEELGTAVPVPVWE